MPKIAWLEMKTGIIIKGRVAWDQISGVENDRIYEIDEDILIKSSPRTMYAIKTLAKLFHPEQFS